MPHGDWLHCGDLSLVISSQSPDLVRLHVTIGDEENRLLSKVFTQRGTARLYTPPGVRLAFPGLFFMLDERLPGITKRSRIQPANSDAVFDHLLPVRPLHRFDEFPILCGIRQAGGHEHVLTSIHEAIFEVTVSALHAHDVVLVSSLPDLLEDTR